MTIEANTVNKVSNGILDFRMIIMINLLIIAFFDSYAVYGYVPIIKVGVYGLKFINVLALIYLLLNNNLKNYLSVLLVFPFWWFFLNETDVVNSFQLLFSGVFPILTFLLLQDHEKEYVAWSFVKILYYCCLIGLPIYLLINLVGVPHLFTLTKGEGVGGAGRIYYNYFLLYWTRNKLELRFSSVFDEPGVLGTFIPLIIFYFRDKLTKLQTAIFIIAGFLTFSLFFTILIVPAFYFSNLRNQSKRSVFIRSMLFFIVLIIAYVSLVFYARATLNDRAAAIRVYYRFKWENGWIVGVVNNRDAFVKGFDDYYNHFNDPTTVDYYIGRGKKKMVEEFGGSTLSYRVLHLNKGMLIILYLMLLLIIIHPWRKQPFFSFISMIILILTFYQRPLLYSINFIILLYVGIHLLSKTNTKEIKEIN